VKYYYFDTVGLNSVLAKCQKHGHNMLNKEVSKKAERKRILQWLSDSERERDDIGGQLLLAML